MQGPPKGVNPDLLGPDPELVASIGAGSYEIALLAAS